MARRSVSPRKKGSASKASAASSTVDSKKRARARLQLDDDHIDSSEGEDNNNNNRDNNDGFEDDELNGDDDGDDSSGDPEEDLATKKVRLAREYLERLEGQDDESDEEEDGSERVSERRKEEHDDDDDDEEGEDRVSRRLRDRRLEQTGMKETQRFDQVSEYIREMERSIIIRKKKGGDDDIAAASHAWVSAGQVQLLRGHDLALTCVALQAGSGAAHKAISGSKDHSVLLWDVETSKKLATVCPHWKHASSKGKGAAKTTTTEASYRTQGQVLSVACSERYAAVGSRDAVVRIYDLRTSPTTTMSCIKEFKGLHKGPITALCFQTNSSQLFSGSDDRLIRSYNLDEMAALETLYGHQLGVTGLDCMTKELPVSVGRDRTARAWKLSEDTHMIYRGGSLAPAASCISLVKEDWFVTGHEDNGQVSLWATDKKKPVATVFPETNETAASTVDRSVVSIATLKRSDLCLTGSCNGWLQTWRIRTAASKAEGRDITPGPSIPLQGYLNDIAMGPHGKFCLVAVGNEHRMGRWNPVSAKNRLAVVSLQATTNTPPQSNQQSSSS